MGLQLSACRQRVQGMHDRRSAAEVLAGVLSSVLQRLHARQSLAEELVEALEQARLHNKESRHLHLQATRCPS